MKEVQLVLELAEMKPDSSDFKEYSITLKGPGDKSALVAVNVPDSMIVDVFTPQFKGTQALTPMGVAYVASEIDLAIQRTRALRKPEYDAITDGSYFKKAKKRD